MKIDFLSWLRNLVGLRHRSCHLASPSASQSCACKHLILICGICDISDILVDHPLGVVVAIELTNLLRNVGGFRMLLAAYPGVIVLRLFKAFNAQPRLALVTRTLQAAGTDLYHFMLSVAIRTGVAAVPEPLCLLWCMNK